MERIMLIERIMELIRSILGALGWLLFGLVLMCLEIGPWWVWWLSICAALVAMGFALDRAFPQKQRW